MRATRIRNQHGFTAVELMVVIAILAILAAFAAPSMTKLLTTQKVRSFSYDLNADLTFARSQSISRGHAVSVASTNGTNWVTGWTITDTTSNTLLRQASYSVTGVSFTADQTSVAFDRSGRTSNIVSFAIIPTDTNATTDQKRCLRIDPSGRPHTYTGVCPS